METGYLDHNGLVIVAAQKIGLSTEEFLRMLAKRHSSQGMHTEDLFRCYSTLFNTMQDLPPEVLDDSWKLYVHGEAII